MIKNYFKSRVGLVVIGCIISLTFGANSVKANNPVPSTEGIAPTTKVINSAQFDMNVYGTGFVQSSVVKFNGGSKTTLYVASTLLVAEIPTSDLSTSGTFHVIVFNPAPGGGTSNSQTFTVTNHAVPTTTSIFPTTKVINSSGFYMTVHGTGFDEASVVKFNGGSMNTRYYSSTELDAYIFASDLYTVGTFNITVTNPAPGGGTSNSQTFTVTNHALPTTTSIDPTTVVVNSGQFNIVVWGSNFDEGSVVKFNGSVLFTTYLSSIQLEASVPASYITVSGTKSITVYNPTPGGGNSNSQTLTVTDNPVPTTTSISPTTKVVNSAQFTMHVYGTGFANAAAVKFNGAFKTTTYVSSTELDCLIPASDLTTAGTFSIIVTNPTPGGGDSNSQTFTVTQ